MLVIEDIDERPATEKPGEGVDDVTSDDVV